MSAPAPGREVTAKDVFALAVPALGVLAATPLYLLLDTAVVGRLGGLEQAALAVGTTIQSQVTTQLTFLSYGTTARASRLFGQGRRAEAVAEGVQATWVALAVGVALTLGVIVGAPVLAGWLGGSEEVARQATAWMRLAAVGIPLTLIVMAGHGWLRGVQDTRRPLYFTLAGVIPGALLVPVLVGRLGLVGSAVANLLGVSVSALLFLGALVREHRGPWRPQWAMIRSQLVLGRDLIVRSASFQVAFLSAAGVAGRFGVAALAAHQILLQLWNFLTLVLDSLAIAAQTLTGAALGQGTVRRARAVGLTITRYSFLFSCGLAACFTVGAGVIPGIFSSEEAVLGEIRGPWWLMIAMIVMGGVLFALDGVLLGAADAAFLRNATVAAVLCGFLPGVWLAYAFHSGLVGVWCGLVAFIGLRLVAVVWRFRSMRWAVT
ncbi:MATE family efflux transporter [Corynebacterium sp. zg-331]|uniref:MATE family efflux transporter n=1 Tax=unclassified Corynebacterium TaxID=2624378 RepID=UPI00128CD15B|nr:MULTISPECIES: MATE family efflux transporter [unclassified Corynebacterium]MBC3185359.1 MATE family efflux transporter [Corynebacterium sp. zg-331]MPV51856.1 MATE family efflux transporter [Corynebacterium sp. zg331]